MTEVKIDNGKVYVNGIEYVPAPACEKSAEVHDGDTWTRICADGDLHHYRDGKPQAVYSRHCIFPTASGRYNIERDVPASDALAQLREWGYTVNVVASPAPDVPVVPFPEWGVHNGEQGYLAALGTREKCTAWIDGNGDYRLFRIAPPPPHPTVVAWVKAWLGWMNSTNGSFDATAAAAQAVLDAASTPATTAGRTEQQGRAGE